MIPLLVNTNFIINSNEIKYFIENKKKSFLLFKKEFLQTENDWILKAPGWVCMQHRND